VRAFCFAQALAHLADDAELLTSEIVGNAVEHVGTPLTVVATCDALRLWIQVLDGGRSPMTPTYGPSDFTAEHGRGLHIVDAIAGAWGVSPLATGKSVWFCLP
jgi:anti-sigma regulatory factor (Ser/Thr protein kinase)